MLASPASPSSAEHDRAPEEPVPRWSKTIRSRPTSAGAIALCSSRASGIAACPGPPASATTAVSLGAAPACSRSTRSPIAPGPPGLRTSGTLRVAQEKPPPPRQGAKASASALVGRANESSSAASGAADISCARRRGTATDVSGAGRVTARTRSGAARRSHGRAGPPAAPGGRPERSGGQRECSSARGRGRPAAPPESRDARGSPPARP